MIEVDCVIALRVPETPQGVGMLRALRKLHAERPDAAGINELKALPGSVGAAFSKAFGAEPVQTFRLYDFVVRGPQAAFSLVLGVEVLETTFRNLLLAFDAAGCRRIEATAKADELARHYTCAAGVVEWTTERGDEGISDDADDAPSDES